VARERIAYQPTHDCVVEELADNVGWDWPHASDCTRLGVEAQQRFEPDDDVQVGNGPDGQRGGGQRGGGWRGGGGGIRTGWGME
jgi:hypothetical protein